MSRSEASGSFNVDRGALGVRSRARVADGAHGVLVPRPTQRASEGGHAARRIAARLTDAVYLGALVVLAALLLGGCATAGGERACSTWSTAQAAACAICALPSCRAPEVGAEDSGEGGELEVFEEPSTAGEHDVSLPASGDGCEVSRGPRGDASRAAALDTSREAFADASRLQTRRLAEVMDDDPSRLEVRRLRRAPVTTARARGERFPGVPIRWARAPW